MSVKPTVLWVEGCFDGFHYGHGNLLRQARNAVAGPVHVIAAVHSDADILKNKGPPLFDERERYSVVASCRWVDEVVVDAPYSPQLAVLDKHNVDFVVHGNDTVKDASGRDIYEGVRQVGRFIECKRLDGVSTTDIIQSLLYPSTSDVEPDDTLRLRDLLSLFADSTSPCLPIVDLTAASTIGTLPYLPDARTVYVGGGWDCFGSAHIEYLRRVHEVAKGIEEHTSVVVIVGVWSDEVSGRDAVIVWCEKDRDPSARTIYDERASAVEDDRAGITCVPMSICRRTGTWSSSQPIHSLMSRIAY